SLRHDVNMDYLIPDLTKIFADTISKSVNRDLMSSLGLIELQGFGTRQEAMMNPKVMIEEVVDAVGDWAGLLNEVMLDLLEKNKASHPNLSQAEIQVIPGLIKAFLTDEMRAMIRSMYDRGDISRQDAVEQTTSLDFETQVQRIIKEKARGLDKICKPPIIQNLEQYDEPDDTNKEDQNKKPGTPEADNFNSIVLKNYKSILEAQNKNKTLVKCKGCNLVFDYASVPENRMGSVLCPGCKKEILQDGKIVASKKSTTKLYETVDDLPSIIKKALPLAARLIWLREFKNALNYSSDVEVCSQTAWEKVEEKYEKISDEEKWTKKATIDSYKNIMSTATFKFFEQIYDAALVNSKSTENALETAKA
ncbi:hypothetical protein LCGC14_3009200, partial [marine sediment metagenome]